MERTLTIVKPDGVAANLIGEIVRRLEGQGLRPVAMKMLRLSREQAANFYYAHRDKEFFEGLMKFMTSGPVVVLALEGEGAITKLREIMGATDPAKASPGTLRRDFASSIEKNIIHGSDSPSSAAFEIGYFFNSLEVCRR